MLFDNSQLITYRAELFKLLYKYSPQLENMFAEKYQLQYILQAVEINITLNFRFLWITYIQADSSK